MLTNILEPSHLVIILAIALLVLGPKRLPSVGRALGHGLNEFRSSLSGGHSEEPQPGVSGSSDREEDVTPGRLTVTPRQRTSWAGPGRSGSRRVDVEASERPPPSPTRQSPISACRIWRGGDAGDVVQAAGAELLTPVDPPDLPPESGQGPFACGRPRRMDGVVMLACRGCA
jgi:TatA/E family protein of Tat protein translocase